LRVGRWVSRWVGQGGWVVRGWVVRYAGMTSLWVHQLTGWLGEGSHRSLAPRHLRLRRTTSSWRTSSATACFPSRLPASPAEAQPTHRFPVLLHVFRAGSSVTLVPREGCAPSVGAEPALACSRHSTARRVCAPHRAITMQRLPKGDACRGSRCAGFSTAVEHPEGCHSARKGSLQGPSNLGTAPQRATEP
jgi:hypothetical protein